MNYLSVVVAGVGARTAVGMTAPASAAAVRAGIVRVREHPFLFDAEGNPFLVAQPSYLEIDFHGGARLAELAGPAAREALTPLASSAGGNLSIPVYLGFPPARPGRPADALSRVIDRVRAEMAEIGISPTKIQTIETGHSAGAMALQLAWEAVRSGAADVALAGGVDSYLDRDTMAWLHTGAQLHGADGNSWGFVPGEAAGFALFTSARVADRLASTAVVEMVVAATARETKLIKTDAVCLGEGLTDLFRALTAGLSSGEQADDLICDMNGEPYRADEFGFAVLRAGQMFRNASEFATPASSWGDVGAASGPLFLALADAATRRRYSSGPMIAAFTSAESGERSGFVVRARDTGRQRQRRG